METIFVSLVSMALIVISTVTLTFSTLKSANRMADAWRIMETQSISVARTDIAAVAPDNYHGGIMDLTIENDGHVNLADFSNWDVIIQYQGGASYYLTYSANYPPEAGQWTLSGIYVIDGSPEVFDPNMLNPGEKMIVSLNPNIEIEKDDMVRVIVSTPSGVTTQCYVTCR